MQGPCQPPPPPRERQSDGLVLTKVEPRRLRYQRHARTPKGAGSLKSSALPAARRHCRRRLPFEIRCRKDLMQVQSGDFNMVNLLRFRFQGKKKKVATYFIWLSDLQLNMITFNLTAKWRPGQGHTKKNPQVV